MKVWTALYGALGIGCGAFGAHALKKILSPEALAIWDTAVRYHLFSSLFLLVLFLMGSRYKLSWIWMSWGSLIFTSSLYALALSGIKILGAITPIGGVMMILAWIMLLKVKAVP